jgi:hypothetical protein
MAETGGLNAHQDFALPRAGEIDFANLERTALGIGKWQARLLENGGADFHAGNPILRSSRHRP